MAGKPWTTPQFEQKCLVCSKPFLVRRPAKYCSELCMSRARPKRAFKSGYAKERRRIRLQKPGYRESVNAKAKARHDALCAWLDAYKLRYGCIECGYNKHPVGLDFDHIPSLGRKEINVCNAKSIAQAQAEIAKCEVVCAICHRIRTAERLGIRHSIQNPLIPAQSSEEQAG
jgi:hypothetical protein